MRIRKNLQWQTDNDRCYSVTRAAVRAGYKIVTYCHGRRRQGGSQVRCSCRHVRASLYRDKSAAIALAVHRCPSSCTESERDERCASPTHQTEPLEADNQTLHRHDSHRQQSLLSLTLVKKLNNNNNNNNNNNISISIASSSQQDTEVFLAV